MDIFTLGFWAGLGLAIPLGPMAILLITTTMAKGRKSGSLGALAMASVDFTYAVVVFAVGSIVLQAITPLVFPLRIIGSLVLVVVAVQLFRNAQKSNLEARQVSKDFNRNSLATFASFFGLTVINPATAFYFLAITPSVAQVSVGSGLSGNVLYFAFGVFTGSVIWQFSLVFSAHFMSKRMTLKVQRALQYSGAALIALLSIWLIFKSVNV
jgi:threonine/homoserine/homoserine lactone efflux protein